jgi:hypothetical protein
MTGVQIRYARLEKGDRDMYDFRPRCDNAWEDWLGLRMPDTADHMQVEAGICPGGTSMTGIQVMRGRNDRRDQDYFNFKLRCAKKWLDLPLGLAFDGLRETRSATCPSSAAIAGLRVHRGFQDWGDLDTYEFQLFCTVPTSTSGRGDEGGRSGRSSRKRSHADGDDGGSGTRSRRSSAFGSRGADADAAADEVRAELRAAAARSARQTRNDEYERPLSDEL